MQLLNGSQAAAHAAMVSGAKCVIGGGPSAKAIEALKTDAFQPEVLNLPSDSASSAAASRMLAGQRCYIEDAKCLKDLALSRLPVVCTSNTPKNWSIVLAPASVQEALDDCILARALAERALLPATVVIDRLLGETSEIIDVPTEKIAQNFLGQLKLDKDHAKFARGDLEGVSQAQKATEAAVATMPKLAQEWKKRFRRMPVTFEPFMLEDAEIALIVYGSWSSNAKLAAQALREQGQKVGVLRLRMLRPLPEAELHSALQNVSRIAVIDNQISLGGWSKLYHALKPCYSGFASNFITGDLLKVQDFTNIAQRLRASSAPERVWMIE